MKCIQCGTDNKLKDRTSNQGRCIRCQHPFVFEPTNKDDEKITDSMFAKAIADISTNNTLFFTPKQFLYFLDNRVKRKRISGWGWLGLYLFFNVWATGFIGGFSSIFLAPILASFKLPASTTFIIANLGTQIWYIYKIYQDTKSSLINQPRRKENAQVLRLIGLIILIGGIYTSLFIFHSFILFVIYVLLGMLSIYLGFKQLNQSEIPQESLIRQEQVQSWLNRWRQINGSITKILPPPREEIAPAAVNPDVTAYSFDRLVVCDSAAIAQMLIANNFHFEKNCAILSISGYPQNIFDTTMLMLRRNPDLIVYALHDCSPRGVSLVNHLRTSSTWFLNSNVTMIDIGLLPRQIIAASRGMFIQSQSESAEAAKQLAPEIRSALSTDELEWLESGNFVELESFSPQKLIQILNHGIVNSQTLDSDDSSLILVDDTGNSMYVAESFG
ncbi:hypothetical protein [Brasilonema bromeliae]|uniref:DUF2628 domain-containing protein n=1 Tax=Brasilonema bromeliae SPC951 TaxID=385972 RepID=A0ABX1PAG8_9CYAN|nr:hypothetical protein [Brasilonema bromeliae]NMG21449.1 hypothetical protein [Brasilonema bromeliae SPC951]